MINVKGMKITIENVVEKFVGLILNKLNFTKIDGIRTT